MRDFFSFSEPLSPERPERVERQLVGDGRKRAGDDERNVDGFRRRLGEGMIADQKKNADDKDTATEKRVHDPIIRDPDRRRLERRGKSRAGRASEAN